MKENKTDSERGVSNKMKMERDCREFSMESPGVECWGTAKSGVGAFLLCSVCKHKKDESGNVLTLYLGQKHLEQELYNKQTKDQIPPNLPLKKAITNKQAKQSTTTTTNPNPPKKINKRD